MSKDLYRGPDGVLYQLDSQQDVNGMVSLYTQGGGRIYRVPTRYFHAQFKLDWFGEYKLTRVTIDDDPVSFECWLNDECWNGWRCPVFTAEQAKEVLKFFTDIKYDEALDAYYLPQFEEGDPREEYEARLETLDGVATKVYPIGSQSWIWDEVTTEETSNVG